FREDGAGEVKQFILSADDLDFRLGYKDLRTENEPQLKLKEEVQNDFRIPFDLSAGPLLRACLYQLAESKYVLSYVMHHIISDAQSMVILLRELELFYNQAIGQQQQAIAPLKIQYKDYAAWQQMQLNEPALQEHKNYWLKNFSGELPVLNLVTDKPRPAWKTFAGETVLRSFRRDTAIKLKALLSDQKCTLFMGLVAVVDALLYKYTGQEDIIIGSPIDSRDHVDLENQIGFYLNTLALRTTFSGNDGYSALLQKVKQVTVKAYDHQSYPFDELVEELQLQRDMSRNPLFDVSVVLLTKDAIDKTAPAAARQGEIIDKGLQSQVSKFDLTFDFSERGNDIELNLVYDVSIYDRNTAERLADHLLWLTGQMIDNPGTAINRLSCLGDEERRQLLKTFQGPAIPYPKDVSLIHLFEQQVRQRPGSIALVYENRSISYGELNERANQLAGYLREQYKIGREDFVAILLDRSEWMIASILATLKAGGAYVPIDPAYPQERIGYMIADSGCKAVIDDKLLSAFREKQHLYAKENLLLINQPADLAYVIY
ncbi:MAG: condensation domain-containing protein, partial [Chitinophagaceae bacterium]